MQPSKPVSLDSHCIQQSVRAKSVWSLWLSFASPHCQALWTCSRPRNAFYEHGTEHTDRSAQQMACCLHTSTCMPRHTHTTGTCTHMHVHTMYAHMHVQTSHAQTCLHVHRTNLCSSLSGSLLPVCIPACTRVHTHMHVQTTHKHVHRVNSWSSLTGSPKKAKPGKGLTILADTEAPVQSDSAGSPVDRDLMAPKRLGSVRFAADHLQPDSPSGSSITGIHGRSLCCTCVVPCLRQCNTIFHGLWPRCFL